MSTGVGDSVGKTSIRSVSIESGTRNRSLLRDTSPSSTGTSRYGQDVSSSYSLINQSGNAQITDNLRVQHQREKQELSELNDRFRGKIRAKEEKRPIRLLIFSLSLSLRRLSRSGQSSGK